MDCFRSQLRIALIAIWAMGMVVGCAFDDAMDEGQPACSYDADCADDEYCIGDECLARCTDDDQCPSDTYCEVYQRGGDASPVQACIDADLSDDGAVDCNNHEECQDILDDDDALCGMHGRCILSSSENQSSQPNDDNNQNESNHNNDPDPSRHQVVKVEQLDEDGLPVSVDDLDGDESTPLRIGALLLRDDDDSAVGFGILRDVESPSDHDPPAELAEVPVTFDDSGMCVDEPRDAPYTSLGGPGGRAWIDVVDGTHEPILAYEDYRVQIVVDSPECPLGVTGEDHEDADVDDPRHQYRVHLCETDSESSLPDDGDCEQKLGDQLSGFADLKVTSGGQ